MNFTNHLFLTRYYTNYEKHSGPHSWAYDFQQKHWGQHCVGAHYLLINPHYLTLEIHSVHSIIHARVHVPFSTWGYLSSTQTHPWYLGYQNPDYSYAFFYLHSLYTWPHMACMQPSMAATSLPQLDSVPVRYSQGKPSCWSTSTQ